MEIKVIDTPRGNEFIFHNKFSKYRISSDDRKLSSFLHFKYKLINKLRLNKLYKKNSWYRTMNFHWAEPCPEEFARTKSRTEQQALLSKDDLQLKSIIIYDLLPKEYLKDFQERYYKFRSIFVESSVFNRSEKQVSESFCQMENSRVVDCLFHFDGFFIKPETELGKYFSYIDLVAIGLTESYFILKYTLSVTITVNDFLVYILGKNIYKAPICLSNGKWWKKHSFSGCALYDFGNESKSYVLEDYILQLKSIFWKQVEKRMFSKFFSWEMIPPSIEVYSSKTLYQNSKNILSVLSSHCGFTIEQNDDGSVYLVFASDNGLSSSIHNSKIIADIKEFEGENKGQLYSFLYTEDLICKHLADYFILEAVNTRISNSIYAAQLQINKVVGSKRKLKSYLKIKFDIDKKLYFYKRLCHELVKQSKSKTQNHVVLEEYKNIFVNKLNKDNPELMYPFDFSATYTSLYYVLLEKNTLLKSIYEHFDENTKIVANRFNYNLVKWTFWIAFLSLVATILFANNSYVLNAIWKLIVYLLK